MFEPIKDFSTLKRKLLPRESRPVNVYSLQWLQGREWAIVVSEGPDDALRMLAAIAEWPNEWRGIRSKCLHLDVDDDVGVAMVGRYSESKGRK